MARFIKLLAQLVAISLVLAGGVALTWLSIKNHSLAEQIAQLEAELGRMPIDDPDRVHIVEIERPDVPPEVAAHIDRVWQFRCYLPPNYDVVRCSGGGRVADGGVYFQGGSSTGWGSPRKEAFHQLLTISFHKKDGQLYAFNTFGGSSGESSWRDRAPGPFDESVAIQQLVKSEQGPRSFDQGTILPLLRIYDPRSAEDRTVGGATITTFAGGFFVLCPKSRKPDYDELRHGRTPDGFDPSWIASEVADD